MSHRPISALNCQCFTRGFTTQGGRQQRLGEADLIPVSSLSHGETLLRSFVHLQIPPTEVGSGGNICKPLGMAARSCRAAFAHEGPEERKVPGWNSTGMCRSTGTQPETPRGVPSAFLSPSVPQRRRQPHHLHHRSLCSGRRAEMRKRKSVSEAAGG